MTWLNIDSTVSTSELRVPSVRIHGKLELGAFHPKFLKKEKDQLFDYVALMALSNPNVKDQLNPNSVEKPRQTYGTSSK